MKKMKCPRCKGKKKVLSTSPKNRLMVFMYGSQGGHILSEKCPLCYGKGKITTEDLLTL
jgi:DnaJ-class molecular chaperone